MSKLTLDAGALIAFDRNDRRCVALLARAIAHDTRLFIPAGVVGRAWRNGRTQARLATLLSCELAEIEPLDAQTAREAGQLCGLRRTSDVIDASVVLCAKRRGTPIATTAAAALV